VYWIRIGVRILCNWIGKLSRVSEVPNPAAGISHHYITHLIAFFFLYLAEEFYFLDWKTSAKDDTLSLFSYLSKGTSQVLVREVKLVSSSCSTYSRMQSRA
jgi:hypothetical protein